MMLPSRFSALQRAENSSIDAALKEALAVLKVSVLFSEPKIPQFGAVRDGRGDAFRFQCSSASRKFLNLLRCSVAPTRCSVSVLFSEPKIPQFERRPAPAMHAGLVSVLFSEPKIPQLKIECCDTADDTEFQCSSASRKFLN